MTARNILEVSLVRSPSFGNHILSSVSDSSISTEIVLKADCALGQIDFINCLPITAVLLRELPAGLSLTMDTPGALNAAYRHRKLDLGAMSSHYFLEDGQFELFPGISIASSGPVGSVLFFSRKPLDNGVGTLKIAVPRASASSVSLLHILLVESFGITPEFIGVDQPGPASAGVDAFLTFGDSALLTDEGMRRDGLTADYGRFDMASWWFERYKLPMVFGVWAARRSWVEANPLDFAAISTFLAGAAAKGLGPHFQQVLREATSRTGLDAERLTRYYRLELDYGLTDEHRQGLRLYESLCKKHGLLIK